MGYVPTLKTWSDGARVTAADFNDQIRDGLGALLNPPQALVHRTDASATLASGTTYIATPWQVAATDTDGMWNAANPTRLTIGTAGYYLIQAKYVWGNYAAGYRSTWLKVNAGGNPAAGTGLDNDLVQPVPATTTTTRLITSRLMVAGDHLELFTYQTSGATQNSTFGLTGPTMSVQWTGIAGTL
jgi:hypothetical protein